MNFYEINPDALPQGAQYYHNVTVVDIAINRKENGNIAAVWYMEDLTSPQPCAYHVRQIQDRCSGEFSIEFYPHCVVEVHPTLGVSWYTMIDYDTTTPWNFVERYDEDEDEDEVLYV